MNIYDCFMYFDEDLLLDLRLNSLNKYIKKFIITEATYTHNGSQKKLNFDIEVDGGINFENSKIVIEAGANILVSGTTIFKENNGNIKKNIDFLKLE